MKRNSGVMFMGRTNVGKTTLANKLCGRHRGLENSAHHTTRDPVEAVLRSRGQELSLWDTPGPEDDWNPDEGGSWVLPQGFVLVVDGQAGLQPMDEELARMIRRSGRKAICVVNKAEGNLVSTMEHSFSRLIDGPTFAVSAIQTTGLNDLRNYLLAEYGTDLAEKGTDQLALCICGKPNVGKSSLLNALLGEDRIYVAKTAGTTRDLIRGIGTWDGQNVAWTDTPGIRRKQRISNGLESQAVGWALGAFRGMDVVLLVVDASLGLSNQERDLFVLARKGAEVVVIGSKMDLATRTQSIAKAEEQISRFLGAPEGLRVVETSSVTGEGIRDLIGVTKKVYDMASGKTLQKESWAPDELPALSRLGYEFHGLYLDGVNPLAFHLSGLQTVGLGEDKLRSIRRALAKDLDLHGVRIGLVDAKKGGKRKPR